GNRSAAYAQGRAQHPPHAGKPGCRPTLKFRRVGALDPASDVIECQHAEKIDVHRGPPGSASVLEQARQQRCLAISTRSDEATVIAASSPLQKDSRLLIAVEQLIGGNRLAKAKWVTALIHRA